MSKKELDYLTIRIDYVVVIGKNYVKDNLVGAFRIY